MRQYKIKYSKQARQDLGEIYRFIALECGNPAGAVRVIDVVEDKCAKLQFFPRAAAVRARYDGKKFRFMRAGKYTVVYYIDDKNGVVRIYGVFLSKRNFSAEWELED